MPSAAAELAVTVTSAAVVTALNASPDPALAGAFVMYLIPLRFPRRDALWMLAGALLVTLAGLTVFAFTRHGVYRTGGAATAAGLFAESALLIVVAWIIGYSVRQHRAYQAGRQEQAEQRVRKRVAEARRVSTEERLQIAREVHDVVAHTMSVIAVQAGVASYVGAAEPGEAIRALSSIEETSRGALREMRALLNLLRAEGNGTAQDYRDSDLVPVPGLDDLGTLAARTAEAGVVVEVVVRGERRGLPAGLDLAAYRVIQEAVTNVIKHASTDRCTVTVDYQDDSLTVEVTDAGTGAGVTGDGYLAAGHGIAGMRERVGMYRGEFRAGPRPGGGFEVTARFPLKGAAA
jgi:signal transduction histidine kinase